MGQAALDDALRYAQQREAFGKPIWKHQSIGNYLADMVTKLTAARQLVLYAARCYDSGRRADMEAGMAKLFASETAMEIALDAVRIHGGYGYSTEFDVERYFRDAPLMIVGEGTNEIQRNVIARQLIQRHPAGRDRPADPAPAQALPLAGIVVVALEQAVAVPVRHPAARRPRRPGHQGRAAGHRRLRPRLRPVRARPGELLRVAEPGQGIGASST